MDIKEMYQITFGRFRDRNAVITYCAVRCLLFSQLSIRIKSFVYHIVEGCYFSPTHNVPKDPENNMYHARRLVIDFSTYQTSVLKHTLRVREYLVLRMEYTSRDVLAHERARGDMYLHKLAI